jgi:RNA polymerase sigma-70 factor, ECF subfamily
MCAAERRRLRIRRRYEPGAQPGLRRRERARGMNAADASARVADLAQRHLDAAYNLARWLLGSEPDAADAVHDAYLRAARAANTYAGGNERSWWLAIVRNCCLARLTTRSRERRLIVGDGDAAGAASGSDNETEASADAAQVRARIVAQLRALPPEYREALVLRELEDLSYREIADVLGVPIGTVMSRLARGRALLLRALAQPNPEQALGM